MLVRELIERLQELPQDAPVAIFDGEYWGLVNQLTIETRGEPDAEDIFPDLSLDKEVQRVVVLEHSGQ